MWISFENGWLTVKL